MKCSRNRNLRLIILGAGVLLATCASLAAIRPLWHGFPLLFTPGHGFESWIENVPAGSDIEKAVYRAMQLPGGDVLFRRTPRETVPALTSLQEGQKTAALYFLRALEEEQALDFAAAERDWKSWADQSDDRVGAHLDLADFYERRLQPTPEITTLEIVGNAPPDPRERWTAVELQRSWKAFERATRIANDYGLPRAESDRLYAAWLKRYSQVPSIYSREFEFLLAGNEWNAAAGVIDQYRTTFPSDHVFPVKAEAELAARRGRPQDGLAIYEARFEPLWPAELVKSYFALVIESRQDRAFSDALRAKLAANPDDLKDTARLFYLYQQQGRMDSAKAVLAHFREQKETRGAPWTAEELDTLEKLYEAIQDFPESARYAYALAADKSSPGSEQKGIVALTRILLTAPEQPLRMGAGNLALYKNIATMDHGPGYLNGILSLWLNTQGPQNEYANEDQIASPYFHRARAAELLAQIDQRFPADPARPQLHASLMEAYAAYGENQAVIREGVYILAQFPQFDGRVAVALSLADAYERTRETDKEFAVYQHLLQELSAHADGVPLGTTGAAYSKPVEAEPHPAPSAAKTQEGDTEASAPAPQTTGIRSVQYNEVLNRYLARLVALRRLPDALNVLRAELGRNPQDPGLYQKLADFLDQNSLNSHEEEVYQHAIQQFQETSWCAKLARFYLRQRRNADYSAIMRKVADVFSGTEIEQFLQSAPAPDRSLAIQVNLYAHQRFPHDLRFVERLISEYGQTGNLAERDKLLWQHWWESPDLRNQLLGMLSGSGKLDEVLATLKQQSPEIDKGDWTGLAEHNPAAERFYLESCLWQSHFEEGIGASDALAAAYPADTALGAQASSLYRSLAYFHPEDTDKAVSIEKQLLDAQPGNLDTLARIGDIYADRDRFAEAAPYWIRMGDVHPGEANGYLQSATVFWDYFDFASAQKELEKGRTRLNQPALFGYQEGAIAESRGDLSAAMRAYTLSATAGIPSNESRDRLLTLAHRSALWPQLEAVTADLLKKASPTASAVELRADILEAEHRKDDLAGELNNVVSQTDSFDVLDAITNAARAHALPGVEEAALRRQIGLTTDPVRNLQLRYQLVDFLQQRNAPAAAQEIDSIYREHGKILGVVRSTVDYDWNHDRKTQAVTVLLESGKLAYPDLKSSFQLEAARKLTDLGDFTKSRNLLTSLLSEKPLDASFESAMADNLARSNDVSGLEAFYRSQLDLVRKSNLERGEKQQRIGQLRRGMIAAATQLGNSNEGIDQYIELLNSYPDDTGLAQEAALYAIAHSARDRLFAFYQKAIAESPRDPRWSIVLARLATAAEDNALAIDAYSKALKLRPERQDLYIAQGLLDERMHRLDDAIALYRKLYTLSYRDPKWMERVAELSARQGRAADAVKALETGWIEGRPAKASNFFVVAERLEKWGILDEARRFAEQGVTQAGADLLTTDAAGAASYARILARQRQTATALGILASAREQAPKVTVAAVAQQLLKNGLAAVTDEEWRKQREDDRRKQATAGFAQALKAMGEAVAEFYAPEEKLSFANALQQNSTGANADELNGVYLPAVRAAGLAQLSADMMWNIAVQNERTGNLNFNEWIAFEKRRVRMKEAAAQLEMFAPAAARIHRVIIWRQAAQAYRDAGDTGGELRALEQVAQSEHLQGDELNRYYRLLLAQRPQELIQIAAREDTAAQYLVRNGNPEQALSGIRARAANRNPVWGKAYTALTGLYLRQQRPEIQSAFSTALDSESTIGDRVTHPLDRAQHLAGEVWFYYGSRYAEYLDAGNDPRAADYLESELEHAPGNPDPYLHLADYSNQKDREVEALTDYQHSLDLNRDQPAVLDKIATIQWNAGRHAEALAAWSDAIKRLAEEMDARHVPETFWGDFERVLNNISSHGQFDSVREPVESMLRIYIARNGNYRVEPLLRAAYHANGDSIEWLLNITSAAHDQEAVLNSVVPNSWSAQGEWIKQSQLSRIYARMLDLAERNSQQNPGQYDFGLDNARRAYVGALLKEKRYPQARSVLSQVPSAQQNSAEWLPYVLQLADAEGTLQQLLNSWKKLPSTAPADDALRNSTGELSESASRAVRRFVYERALDRRELTAANFLGLAAIDLEENNTADAVQLLKRLTLVSDNIYPDTDAAARLLEDSKKPQEALQFLRPLSDDSPWNAEYKVRLAKAMLAVDSRDVSAFPMLNSILADPNAAYMYRVAAAVSLKGKNIPANVSDELKLLAQSGCPSTESASKPLFVQARIAAAPCASSPNAKERLLGEALAASPGNSHLRMQYIWSAFDGHFDLRALVAADQYLQPFYFNPANDVGGEKPSFSPNGERATNESSLQSLKPERALKLVQLASSAYERKRDYADGVRIVTQAMQVLHDSASQKELQVLEKRLNEEIARVQENDARAPNVHPDLDQDRVVTGKLLPGMPVSATPQKEDQE